MATHKINGIASRFATQNGTLSDFIVSTSPILVHGITINSNGSPSFVTMQDNSGATLARWSFLADTWLDLEIPFIAKNGLKFSGGFSPSIISVFYSNLGV